MSFFFKTKILAASRLSAGLGIELPINYMIN